MKKILLLLLVALSLFSCDKENIDVPQSSRKGRTVLAYLVSNNKSGANLDSDLKANIKMMYQGLATLTDTCSLIVYYRPCSDDSYLKAPCIIKYETDGHGNINGKSALTDSELTKTSVLEEGIIVKQYERGQIATDPDAMPVILSDMMNVVLSDSYGLILGSHGTGWLPGEKTVRSFGDDNAYSIDIPQLARALAKANNSKFDFILFDACLMGNIEVLYELRDVAHYCIVSPQEVPVRGFPYNSILPLLYSTDVAASAKGICDEYIANNEKEKTWGTVTFADCTLIDELANAVRMEITSHREQLADFDYKSLQQYGGNSSSFRYMSTDLLQFIDKLNGGTIPSSFRKVFNDLILYTKCIEDNAYYPIKKEYYSGIGLYIPSSRQKTTWNNYFKSSIAWYQAAGWAETESIWGN